MKRIAGILIIIGFSTIKLSAQCPDPFAQPTLSITQPTCAVQSGTILITAPLGSEYEYSIDGVNYQAAAQFSGVAPGTYQVYASLITEINCISAPSSAIILAVPVSPSVPTVSSTTQPTCGTPTGTIVFNTQTGVEYSVGSAYQTDPTFEGLAPATYTLSVRSTTDNTCISYAASTVTLTAASIPAVPTVSSITQPTCAVPTGIITFNAQAGVEYSVGSGYQTSATFTDLAPATYTLSVRSTTDNTCISYAASTVTLNTASPPTVPTVEALTQPTCSVPNGTIVFTTQSGVEYSVGSGYQSSAIFTELAPATYTLSVRRITDNTCISYAASTVTINSVPSPPAVPTVSSATQPTCGVPTGTIVFNTQTGVQYSVGSGYQASATFAGLAPGTYTLSVRSTTDNTCITYAASTVTINSAPSPPAIPTAAGITQPTCSVPTGTIVFNTQTGVQYSVGSGYQASATFTGLAPATYTLSVRSTTDNTCISYAASTVTLNTASPPAVPTVSSVTQPTCSVPTGTIIFTTQSGVEYSVGSGYQSSTTFTGLAPATYTLSVRRITDNTCISFAASTVTLNTSAPPPVPTVSTVSQPTCSVSTGTIIFNTQTGVQYSIGSGYQTSATFTGLAPATYTLSVRSTIDNTCISYAASTVTINSQPPTPSAPVIGTIIQPSCTVATGSIPISGLPSSGTWTLTRNPGNTTSTGTGTTTTVTGLSPNTYTFTVTNSYGCTSALSASAVINAQPPTPTTPVTGTVVQPTCALATGSVPFSGLPSSGTWTLTGSPGNITATGSGTTTTVTGLEAGTYTFTVTNSSGCISSASSNVVVNSQPVTPAAPVTGTITHPTCTVSTGSVPLSGLPSTGTWILTRLPDYITTTGSGTTNTISGIPAGTYTFTVTNASGCTSLASSSVTINAQPPTPTAPVPGTLVQPTCTVATGGVPFSGLPSSGTWTLTGSPGNITATGSGTTTTITGITAGTYTFIVTNSSGCISAPTSALVINTQPVTPSAPSTGTITQPTCTVSTGSIVINGLPSDGTWSLSTSPATITTTGTGTSATVTAIPSGTYTFSVTNASGCSSLASPQVVINSQPATPVAPVPSNIIQPTCTVATGGLTLNSLPASGTWTLTRIPGNITTTGTGESTSVSDLAAGTYSYTVTNSYGCTSASSTSFTINSQPVTPTAPVPGAIVQPTCTLATGTIPLSGLPSTGTWTLTRTPGNITNTGTGTGTSVSGLAAGTYNFTVTNSSGCTSLASINAVITPQPITPSVPVINTVTQPTCTVSTGSAGLTGLPASGTWTIIRLPGNTETNGSGVSTTLSGLPAGSFTFTVTNSSGCTSASSQSVTINAQPVTPSAPVVSSVTQPTINNQTGSVVLSGLPSSGAWTLHRTPGNINSSGSGTSSTISGLDPGTYTYTVTNSVGCTSLQSASIGLYLLLMYDPDGEMIRSNDTLLIDTPDAGEFSINVESNSNWDVSDNSLWFKAVKQSSSSINISYSENISVKDKTASVIVTYSSNPELIINITQKGRISQIKESRLKGVVIYPNPAGDFLTIKSGEYDIEKLMVAINDMQGHIIISREYDNIPAAQIIELNISLLPVGQYLVRISDGSGFKTFQVIKY